MMQVQQHSTTQYSIPYTRGLTVVDICGGQNVIETSKILSCSALIRKIGSGAERLPVQCTEVRFACFLSVGFTTMAVINPRERKLAKHILKRCLHARQVSKIPWMDNNYLTSFINKVSLYSSNSFHFNADFSCLAENMNQLYHTVNIYRFIKGI